MVGTLSAAAPYFDGTACSIVSDIDKPFHFKHALDGASAARRATVTKPT
jgi:hypothetical protein